jgi:hypothetical protein
MNDLDATILRALAANDPAMADDNGLLSEDEFLEQLLKVTGSSQEGYEMPSNSSFDIEPIEFLSNLTQTNDESSNHTGNFIIKSDANVNLADKTDVGTRGLIDFLNMCEQQLDSETFEEDPFEPVPFKPRRERRKRRSVPNLAQARLPVVEFIRNASMAMQPSLHGMDEDFMENSKKLDMFLQENNGRTADLSETGNEVRATTGKRRREHNQGRNSLPTMHIGEIGTNNAITQRPAPLLTEADLEGLDLTDYEDNGAESNPKILDEVPLLGMNGRVAQKSGETHSMHERLLRLSGDAVKPHQSFDPMQTEGRVRRLSGGSLGGVEERLRRISVENVEDAEHDAFPRERPHFSNQSSMGETHSMEERLRRISKESCSSTISEPLSSPDRRFRPSGGEKRNSPTPTAETHSMEERLRRISADSVLMPNSSRAETHSMEERLRRISGEAGSSEQDLVRRAGSVASSHASETHSMEERLRRISGCNRNLSVGCTEDRIRRASGENSRSPSTSVQRGNGRSLTVSPKAIECGHSNHGDIVGSNDFNTHLMENSAKLDMFLASRGGDFTAPLTDESEDHPAPKRRKSLEQQRSSLPPMHISTNGGRPIPLLSKNDLADLDLSDFDDSTDDDTPISPNDTSLRFAVNLEKQNIDRRKAFRKRQGRQHSLPDLHALAADSLNSEAKHLPRRSESSSPVESQHDPLGILKRLRNLMKRTQRTQQALQEWDKLNGLPKSHSQTMVNSSRSRRQIQEGRIIPKWDGTPLINEETELGKPKPRAKLSKATKK